MAATDAFVRLLARFETPLLHRHCHEELDAQLYDIRAALHALSAANEQLQTVREAVARLEAGHADVHRSTSVMKTLEHTAQLQQALGDRIDRLASVLTVSVQPVVASTVSGSVQDEPMMHKTAVMEATTIPVQEHTLATNAAIKAEPPMHSGSETESDTETNGSRPLASSGPTQDHATKQQRASLSLMAPWGAMVEAAMAEALQITTDKNRPTEATMAHYVATLDGVIQQLELPPDTKFQQLANGRFTRLLKQMIRVFNRGKKVPQLVAVTETLLSILERASARDAELLRGFSGSIKQLAVLKLHMEGLAPRRRPYDKKKPSAS